MKRENIRDVNVVAFFLHSSSEKAEKVLVNGEPEEGEYYDAVPAGSEMKKDPDDGEETRDKVGEDVEKVELNDDMNFKWNGQNRSLMEKGMFVDEDEGRLNVYYEDSSKEPLGYQPAEEFTATDNRILKSEETTRKGIEGAVPDQSGLGGTRWKPILLFIIIFIIAAAGLFVLKGKFPGIIPF